MACLVSRLVTLLYQYSTVPFSPLTLSFYSATLTIATGVGCTLLAFTVFSIKFSCTLLYSSTTDTVLYSTPFFFALLYITALTFTLLYLYPTLLYPSPLYAYYSTVLCCTLQHTTGLYTPLSLCSTQLLCV